VTDAPYLAPEAAAQAAANLTPERLEDQQVAERVRVLRIEQRARRLHARSDSRSRGSIASTPRHTSTTKSACVVMPIETEAPQPLMVEEPGVLGADRTRIGQIIDPPSHRLP
jgi:hypothetical protein